MPCPATQQTLTGSGRDLVEKTGSLDLLRLAAWHAFELATVARAPISTSPSLTHSLLELLEESGVLTSTPHGAGACRALYDPISWNYHRCWSKPVPVEAIVREALIARANDSTSAPGKLHLWRLLADAEAENYLTHLCLKHGLKVTDPGATVERVGENWDRHCLARKRYLVWAATKTIAAGKLTSESQELAIAEEIRVRSEWLTNRFGSGPVRKTEYCFIPESPLRIPTLLQTMQSHILPIGEKYWTEIPTDYFERHLAS